MTFQPIRFIDSNKDQSLFASTLRKRVDSYFRDNKISRNNNTTMIIKSVVFLSAYIIPFIVILFFNPSNLISIGLWSLMGLSLSGIGMSIMHDANHGAYSANQKVNYWMGNTLNLVGGSVFNWKLQHNVMHHTYTNIVDYDDDIADKLILKFNPHSQSKWYHKLQFIYAFLFYGILTLYWALLKDFVQFGKYTKQGVNRSTKEQNRVIFLKIVISKIIYFGVFFALPVFVFHIAFTKILLGYLIMQFISGIILTVVFQLAHTVEGTTHPIPDEKHSIENNWFIHQMNTTVNFCRHNKIISWYVGGLNFQVEHHLFPGICHVHYPAISEIVKATAKEFNVPYLENETFMSALKSHINAVIKFGKLPNMNEAIV
jgi:linoleoyl-CoA desaturase